MQETIIVVTKMAATEPGCYEDWVEWVQENYPELEDRPELLPVETKAEAEEMQADILEMYPTKSVSIMVL